MKINNVLKSMDTCSNSKCGVGARSYFERKWVREGNATCITRHSYANVKWRALKRTESSPMQRPATSWLMEGLQARVGR